MAGSGNGTNGCAPHDAHEWVSFEDPDEVRTWVFDVTFLLSPWTCIYGRGCKGVLTGPTPELAQGCCSYGAHFTDEDDVARVEEAAARLTPDQWQFHRQGQQRGPIRRQKDGTAVTRQVQDACIFLNRPDFARGPGCALHLAALDYGERPLDLKPNVCWQLPIRRIDTSEGDGPVVSTIRQWEREDWGHGGEEFHWWCTEAKDAFIGHQPVYLELREELIELVGAKVYAMLQRYLDDRAAGGVFLPHPAVRRRR